MVFLIQNGIFDPFKNQKIRKKSNQNDVFLRKFSEFGSKIPKLTQNYQNLALFLIKNQKILKTDLFSSKTNCISLKITKFIQKLP